MEMNLHLPQSYEASVELQEIAAVPHQLITPRDARPIIGIVQDTLVGTYRITRPGGGAFNLREYMNLMMYNKRFDGTIPAPREGTAAAPKWTGHQVVSTLLPPLNLSMENGAHGDNPGPENKVVIKEGDVLQGTFDKGIFSKASKGIIHTTYNDYGPKDTVAMIDAFQNTIESYLILNGFSVGISDLIADEDTKAQMEEVIQGRKKEVEEILLQVHLDLFDNNTGKTNQEELESKVFGTLNKATDDSGKIGQASLASENRMIAMVKAGSKGGPTNIAQMMACVGQQNIEGKRIPYGYLERTLPHYKKYDDGAEARGFIESSFIRGLTPQEFFFHAMSGREGLIDTACKTAETGYIQRKLIKAMEDLVIQHDGTVRDANMNIVQFTYGEDGTNATKLESVPLPLGKLTEADVETKYGLVDVDFTNIFAEGVDRGADVDPLKEFVAAVKEDRRMVVEGIFASGRQGNVNSPVNLERMINNLKIRFGFTAESKTDLTPAYLLDGIKRILAKTQPNHRLWAAILRFYLAPHSLIVAQRFTKAAFETLAEMIVVKNWQSWAHPGELVGILAAQSIGEPSTQMCCVKSTEIVVTDGKNEFYSGPIGEFINKVLDANAENVMQIGEDHVILDLAKDYFIVGVSDDEKVSWKRISQVSRHPANGGLVKVTTKSGRTTTATLTHSFLKRAPTGVVPVLGSDLAVGDRVPISRSIPEIPGALTEVKIGTANVALDHAFGWLCGIYLADGSVNGRSVHICKIHPVVEATIAELCAKYNWEYSVRNYQGQFGPSKDTIIHSKDLKQFLLQHFGKGSYEKTVGGFAYQSNNKFIAGLIAGYFDGDGNINVERQQIRAGSRSKCLIRHMNRLLAYCGIFGVMSEEKSVRIPDKVMYTLNILKKYAATYKEVIGFKLPEKAAALDQIIEYMERTDKHDTKEMFDKIPALGAIIAETGRLLKMPGQSRNYGRWLKKESVGRLTLAQYVADFKEMMAIHVDADAKAAVDKNIALLESALSADVVWDEIVDLTYLDDPKEHVYDFTVPGNDSFMVDDSILVHNTLNTFHLAGVAAKSNVTRGVPRLNELLKVTKEPKATALTAYLKPEYRESKEKAREVSQDLALTVLREITKKVGIYYDPNDEMTVVEEDRDLMEFYRIFENAHLADKMEQKHSNFMLRIELDRDNMFNKNITMNDVAFVLRNRYPTLHLVYSDYNSNRLVMRIRATLTAPEMDDLENFKKLQNTLLNSVVIRGVPGIKAVNFRKDVEKVEQVDGEYKQITQYVLDTDGSNFLEVMNHPAVDGNRIYSTNVHDIYNQLGVEAARAVLLSEITVLFEEAGLNFRHLGLLCDVMTCSGRLISTDRYGINKTDAGPIGKASFEQTSTILQNAAVFGEVDPITSVSANIMTGQTIRGGTAFSQILLDEQALPRLLQGLPALEGIEEEGETEGDIEQMLEEEADDACGRARFQMNMAIPARATEIDDEDEVELQVI